MRDGRSRLASVASFAATSAAWFVPLVVASAGWRRFLEYQSTQLATVVKQDATIARGPRSWVDLGQRFLFDGWGAPMWASAVLFLAGVGRASLVARRRARASALVLGVGALHLAFTFLSSDPADGVRYALPTQIATAFLAGAGLAVLSRAVPWRRTALLLAVAVIAAISLRYTLPVLDARRTSPSPPVQAANWAKRNLPARAVLLTDPALRPHADLLLKRFRRFPQHEGLAQFWNRPNVPLYSFGHGPTEIDGAMVFSWPYSDAYARLTRNHYRVVSLAPLEPGRRYREVDGVYPWERVAHRREWRWLEPEATLEIPPGDGPLELELELSADPPYPRTTVELVAGGVTSEVSVERGGTATGCIAMPSEGGLLVVRSRDSFVPAEHGIGRDRRRLAVKLLDLRRRPELDAENGTATCAQARRAS
jgi:hypothetical protein